jgi:CheY-like chemotaxis protein
MDRIRIVIADDHPVVRAGLQEMLRSQPDFEIVGEASNGVEAVALVNQVQPDVVLMDLRMTLLDGTGATDQIPAQQANGSAGLTSYEVMRIFCVPSSWRDGPPAQRCAEKNSSPLCYRGSGKQYPRRPSPLACFIRCGSRAGKHSRLRVRSP